ncbi:hypothetical protein MD484_g8139, partial [Candolleomyces efflorescens]
MQDNKEESRLYELGLPADVVEISRVHLDLPPHARARVEGLVKEYEERITQIQERIWSLQLPREYYTRKRLIQERDSIRPKLKACRSLLTIVRRVPVEILGQIFEHYLSAEEPPLVEARQTDDAIQVDEDGKPLAPPPKPSAEILSLVCRYWRGVAVSTPAVWSNIVLFTEQKQGQHPLVTPSQARGFIICMDRLPYGTWTLDVRAREVHRFAHPKYRDVDGPTAVTIPLSHLLNRQPISRLTRFSFTGNATLEVGLGQLAFPGTTSVMVWCPGSSANRNPTLPDLPSMPNLTQAVLWGIASPRYFPTHIPWSQPTHLFLGDQVTSQRWRSIIKQCISLRRASFYLTNRREFQVPLPNEPALATLSHLTELTFLWVGPNADALQGVAMPALTKLQLFVDWDPPAWDFLRPHRYANLTHLTLISPSPLNAGHLIPVLETVPRLRELCFKIFYGFREVFNYLTYGANHGFKIRSLRALGIHMDTQRYRTMYLDEEDEEHEDFLPFLTFPYADVAELVASRTRNLQRGDFNIVTFSNQLHQLENIVLRTDNSEWTREIVEKLKEEVEPFAAYGLDVGVFESTEDGRDHGEAPWPRLGMHWDEGVMGFIEKSKEYSLYPGALSEAQ